MTHIKCFVIMKKKEKTDLYETSTCDIHMNKYSVNTCKTRMSGIENMYGRELRFPLSHWSRKSCQKCRVAIWSDQVYISSSFSLRIIVNRSFAVRAKAAERPASKGKEEGRCGARSSRFGLRIPTYTYYYNVVQRCKTPSRYRIAGS